MQLFVELDLRKLNKDMIIDGCTYINYQNHKHLSFKIEKYFEFDDSVSDLCRDVLVSIFDDNYISPVCYSCIVSNVVIGPYPAGVGRYWPVLINDKYFVSNFVSNLAKEKWTEQDVLSIKNNAFMVDIQAKTKIKIEGPCVWMFVFSNLDHMIRESLPILVALKEQNKAFDNLRFLVPIISDRILNFLVDLGIPRNNIIQINGQWVECTQMYIPCFFSFGHLHTPSLYYLKTGKFIRQKIANKNIAIKTPRYIYVSRNDSKWRRLLNESQLIEILRIRGFEVIIPGDFSITEQVAMFRNAEVIIGPHGMGMANSIFSEKLKLIVEIMPTSWNRVSYFRTAQWQGARYLAYFVSPLGGKQNEATGDYLINISKFINFISKHM